jgi:hypothetical protein
MWRTDMPTLISVKCSFSSAATVWQWHLDTYRCGLCPGTMQILGLESLSIGQTITL